MRLSVRLLGSIDLCIDGRAASVSGLRRKAVLAALALHAGEVVTTDRLIGVVWGDDGAPCRAVNTLQSHISYLRRMMGGLGAITARRPGYRLEPEHVTVDALEAEELVRQGLRQRDPARVRATLGEALALWHGPSLADLAGLPWFEEQAGRLDSVRWTAMRGGITARLELGEHNALVPELEVLTKEQPFDEQLHAQLMLALYRSNRQADALAVYHRLRRALAEELGVEPNPSLRELEWAILRQDASLHAPADDLPQGGIWIAGSAVTAGRWAGRLSDRFPDGRLRVDLSGVDPAEALRGFLEALGFAPEHIPPGLNSRIMLYRSALAGKRMVIVLDGARDAAQVRPLLPGSPTCLTLVSGRSALTPLAVTEGARQLPSL
ncbi:MAG TPA: AfsR/SARP family transcriptional regulator [Candidatus Limnocylindrales bacterium]|nr:AfsR/SARP family transcriptional regulator [Candidatus Limnocylindrales bacterium]